MPTSSTYGWVTPEATDPDDVPLDMANLASQIDTSLSGVARPPILRIFQAGDQSIAANVDVNLTCAESVALGGPGTGGAWTLGSGSWARIVPVSGYYALEAQAMWNPATTVADVRVHIRVGSTIVAGGYSSLSTSYVVTTSAARSPIYITAGTQIDWYVRHSRSAGATVAGGIDWRSWFSARYLRP